MYAAIDLSRKSIQIAIKNKQGELIRESKLDKNADALLRYLKGTNAQVVIESKYNHQFLYDLLQKHKYKVKISQPFTVKVITYAKIKTK